MNNHVAEATNELHIMTKTLLFNCYKQPDHKLTNQTMRLTWPKTESSHQRPSLSDSSELKTVKFKMTYYVQASGFVVVLKLDHI